MTIVILSISTKLILINLSKQLDNMPLMKYESTKDRRARLESGYSIYHAPIKPNKTDNK